MIRTVKPNKKIFLIVIDGLGDRPVNGKTPLSEARIDNINKIAKRSRLGLHTFNFVAPGSAIAHWVLFGYEVEEFPGRGVLEALGHGLEIKEGYTYFRTNFATVDEEFRVIDRRAGDEYLGLEELSEIVKEVGKKYGMEFYRTKGHRGILVVKRDLPFIDDVDPYIVGKKVRLPNNKLIRDFLLEVHRRFEESEVNKVRKVKANFLLLRGFSKKVRVEKFEERYKMRGIGIADYDLYLGVSSYVGMDVFRKEDEKKIKFALDNFEKYDFFFIHFKKCDYYGERKDFDGKKKYLEIIDDFFEELIGIDAIICITGDHSTPWILGSHSGDPCPFLIYNPDVRGEGKKFDEFNCSKGFF